jgi:hypothetical protein
MITSVDNTILKVCSEIDPRFVVYLMSSSTWLNWIQSICRAGGGFRYRVSRSMLGAIQVPVPAFPEQQAIVQHIDDATASLAKPIKHFEREIEFLQGYRTRLIADVVTGKLDVREAARHLPIEESDAAEPLIEATGLDDEEEMTDDAVSDGDEI